MCSLQLNITKNTLDIITTMTFDTTVAFVIPVVALLMSLLLLSCKEQIWTFSVVQMVHLSYLVMCMGKQRKWAPSFSL
jgi:hypothetical protein